jgi:hypothetical protein
LAVKVGPGNLLRIEVISVNGGVCRAKVEPPEVKVAEGERGAMNSATFSQEYMCEFACDGTEYFDRRWWRSAG